MIQVQGKGRKKGVEGVDVYYLLNNSRQRKFTI